MNETEGAPHLPRVPVAVALCLSSRFLGRCVHFTRDFDLIVPLFWTMSTPGPVGRPSERSEVDVGLLTLTSQGEKREKPYKTGLEVDVGLPTLTSLRKKE